MRHCFGKPRPPAIALGLGLLIGTLALMAPPASAGTKGMMLVLPAQKLPLIRFMNQAASFKVARLSQVAFSTGAVMQTALADVQQFDQPLNGTAPFSLLLPAEDVPLIRQLNDNTTISITLVFEAVLGTSGLVLPVAKVNVLQPDLNLNPVEPTDLMLVSPAESMPVLAQLNAGLNLNLRIVLVTRIIIVGSRQVIQTVVLSVRRPNRVLSSVQPFRLFVRLQDIDGLRRLNFGTRITIVNIINVVFRPTRQVMPVALVDVGDNPQALSTLQPVDTPQPMNVF